MQCQGDEFLAGPALAADKDNLGPFGELAELLPQLAHRRALADKVLVAAGGVDAQTRVVGFQGAPGAQYRQALGQIAGEDLAETHLALGEHPARSVDVQRALWRRLPAHGHAQRIAIAKQAIGLRLALTVPGQPDGATLALHALGELLAELRANPAT